MNNKLIRVLLGVIATALFAMNASAGVAPGGLLVNAGFEDTPFGGAEEAGAGVGWSTFGSPFRVQCPGSVAGDPCLDPVGSADGAHGGTVALKVFGVAGAFQDFAASAGESFEGSAWALNPDNADVLTGGQIGAVNIEWHGAGGFIDFSAGTTIDASATVGEWMQLVVAGVAPVGTTFARLVVITGDFNGPGGGAVRFDDAYFDRAAPIPVPAAVWLMGSALLGLMGMRKKAA